MQRLVFYDTPVDFHLVARVTSLRFKVLSLLCAMPPPPPLRPQRAEQPCKFYWSGECNRGIFCSYAHHDGEIGTKFIHYHACKAECVKWQQGSCRGDEYCDWVHTTREEIYQYAKGLADLELAHRKKADPQSVMPLDQSCASVQNHCNMISNGLKHHAQRRRSASAPRLKSRSSPRIR